MKKFLFFPFFLFLFLQHLPAQWNGIPGQVSNPVTTSPKTDINAHSVPDGAGGAITAWTAPDDLTNIFYTYIQRKTITGAVSWGNVSSPVFLGAFSRFSDITDLVADGTGGAYICWQHQVTDTTADLYVQHVSSAGLLLFTPAGIKLNSAANHHLNSGRLCADATGVIVTWADEIFNANSNAPQYAQVFAQRFNLAGIAQWTPGGVQVSIAAGFKIMPEILTDGLGGAFICFLDTRNTSIDANGNMSNSDIFAQHISSAGTRVWSTSDEIVSNTGFNQSPIAGISKSHSMVTDNAGGFIIVYEDYRSNNNINPNFYAQRLTNSGISLWPSGGVALSVASPIAKDYFNMATDGSGGVVVSWDENDFANGGNVHAQRISGAGTVLWGGSGIAVTPAGDFNFNSSSMAADGAGNFVVTWTGYDTVLLSGYIKAQKLNSAGNFQWTAGGVNICTNPDAYPHNSSVVPGSANTIFCTWEDLRNIASSSTDIYAARIDVTGILIGSQVTYSTIANGNWDNAATWLGNVVPPAGSDVIISHNVTANINTSCATLTVKPPGVLTINNGVNITLLQ